VRSIVLLQPDVKIDLRKIRAQSPKPIRREISDNLCVYPNMAAKEIAKRMHVDLNVVRHPREYVWHEMVGIHSATLSGGLVELHSKAVANCPVENSFQRCLRKNRLYLTEQQLSVPT